jgi:hypothetical protein
MRSGYSGRLVLALTRVPEFASYIADIQTEQSEVALPVCYDPLNAGSIAKGGGSSSQIAANHVQGPFNANSLSNEHSLFIGVAHV